MLNIIESITEIYGPTKEDIITSRNFIDKIEIGTDNYGRSYVDLILQGFIEKILSTNSINDLLNIGSSINKSLEQKDIQIFFVAPPRLDELKKWLEKTMSEQQMPAQDSKPDENPEEPIIMG